MKLFISIIFILISSSIFSQKLFSLKQSVCDPIVERNEDLKERIIQKKLINDSLSITLGVKALCCSEFEGNYKLNNDTLYLSYSNIGVTCFCTCFYELTFGLNKTKNIKAILFNDRQYPETDQKYVEYKFVRDTLENGNVILSKFKDEKLIIEIEQQDSIKIYRKFKDGKLLMEEKRKKSR